jgi:hypothetical protein
MSTTAQTIRQAIKRELGYTSKQVSVRTSRGTGSVRLTIKARGLDIDAIRSIAMPHERIYRDDATGEILCGANLFVNVDIDDTLRKQVADEVADEVATAWAKSDGSTIIPLPSYPAVGVRSGAGDGSLWDMRGECGGIFDGGHSLWNAEDAAYCAALAVIRNGL